MTGITSNRYRFLLAHYIFRDLELCARKLCLLAQNPQSTDRSKMSSMI